MWSSSLVRSLGRSRWPPSLTRAFALFCDAHSFIGRYTYTRRDARRRKTPCERASERRRYYAHYSRRARVYSCIWTIRVMLESAYMYERVLACVRACIRVCTRAREHRVVFVVVRVGEESAWVACVRAAGGRMRLAASERCTEWSLPPLSPPETSPPQTHTRTRGSEYRISGECVASRRGRGYTMRRRNASLCGLKIHRSKTVFFFFTLNASTFDRSLLFKLIEACTLEAIWMPKRELRYII